MKKSSSQITDYYQKPSVVTTYDQRRFRGKGGAYIHAQEVVPILKLLDRVLKPEHSILELGSGRGRLTQYLARVNNKVHCLERSASMIGFLKKIVPAKSIFHQSIFDQIKSDQDFDIVTSLRFFEHFSKSDQELIFSNLKESMTTNSYLIYSGVNIISLEGLLTKFFPYGRYNYYYTNSELQQLFAKYQFKVEGKISRFFLPRGIFLYTSNPILLGFLKAIDRFSTAVLPGLCAYQVYLVKST